MEQKNADLDDTKMLSTESELNLDGRMETSPRRKARSKWGKAWIVITVLALVAIAGVGFGVFGIMQARANEARIAELEAALGDAGAVAPPEGETEDAVASITEEVLASVPGRLAINCSNTVAWPEWVCDESAPLYLTAWFGYGPQYWVTVQYNTHTDEIQLRVNWDNIKECNNTSSCYAPLISTERTGEETFTDLGIQGKVIDIYTHNLSSQATGYEVMLFLLDDGTVEYIPLMKALESGDFKVRGKLKGVTDVVKLVETSQFVPGGGRNFWAQGADGKLYSLNWALKETTGDSW